MLNPTTLKNGCEQYEKFTRRGKSYIQYDYRDLDGELFSCVKPTLAEARAAVTKMISEKYSTSEAQV